MRHARRISSLALEYSKHGNPTEVLSLVDNEVDTRLKAGQVLTRTLGAMVNPADVNTVQGVYPRKRPLPAIGGFEGVVEVLAVADDVKNVSPGDWALPSKGGGPLWCSHAVRSASGLWKIDNTLSVDMAASISVNPCTAYRMLSDFEELQRGDYVIQNGATSAVGQAVIQIARKLGVKTINLVRDQPGLLAVKEYLTGLGADVILTEGELKEQRKNLPHPRLALNCVGGRTTLYMAGMLESKGKMVTYGGMSKQPVTTLTSSFIFNDVSLHGFWMTAWYGNPENADARWGMMEFLTRMAKAGALRAPRMQRVNVRDWRVAFERAEAGSGPKQMLVFD